MTDPTRQRRRQHRRLTPVASRTKLSLTRSCVAAVIAALWCGPLSSSAAGYPTGTAPGHLIVRKGTSEAVVVRGYNYFATPAGVPRAIGDWASNPSACLQDAQLM